MLNWIWAAILLAATVASFYISYCRLVDIPDDTGTGFLIGAITGLLALMCVNEQVTYPIVAFLSNWIPAQGSGLWFLTLCVISLAALASYYAILYGVAAGLSAVSTRRCIRTTATQPVDTAA